MEYFMCSKLFDENCSNVLDSHSSLMVNYRAIFIKRRDKYIRFKCN